MAPAHGTEKAMSEGVREPFALFHEENDYYADAFGAYDWIKKNKDPFGMLASLTFGDKKTYVPLQAADILAYESSKRVLHGEGRERRSFTAITPRGRRPVIKYYDKKNMPALVEKLERAKESGGAWFSKPRD
jgi:hypothetical protein